MAAKKPAPDLPPDVRPEDLKWPADGVTRQDEALLGIDPSWDWPREFTFYKTEQFGWVLLTLLISTSGRRRKPGQTDRSYGIILDGEGVCRVGKGPHVLASATVYVGKGNLPRMKRYAELWKQGMAAAGGIRDRISTRRAVTARRLGGFPFGGAWDA